MQIRGLLEQADLVTPSHPPPRLPPPTTPLWTRPSSSSIGVYAHSSCHFPLPRWPKLSLADSLNNLLSTLTIANISDSTDFITNPSTRVGPFAEARRWRPALDKLNRTTARHVMARYRTGMEAVNVKAEAGAHDML